MPNSLCVNRENKKEDPIAIIGIGCRFPGDANSPQTFWKLMANGIDAIREIPADRFDINAFYDSDPHKPGKIITRYGGFLNEIDKLDIGFFGISPREAESLDPQQRLLLEVAWEALEDAGQPLEKFSGSRTGVFIGTVKSDYETHTFADFDTIDFYAATGSALYSFAGRLSYAFNLQGPSMVIGTACSSSMFSTHLALQSLKIGECDMALAGGVNSLLNVHPFIAYSKGGILSPEGRCKFGDAGANGYVRGEGCGIVVLKPLSRALEDGDRIYALIMGSAVNNDGRQGHFLAPSPEGQEAVQRAAYCAAGLQPNQVHYVEAHGTGTAVGDPIEIKTLSRVMGKDRPLERPCSIGSVKTNIGHLESASGIAGLIKAALCLHYRQIPPSLHFNSPNPEIPWNELKLRIQKELIPLSTGSEPAIIGVNSFGLTGMNAHIVLQEAPPDPEDSHRTELAQKDSERDFLLPLSARCEPSLSAMVKKWHEFLSGENSCLDSLYDICSAAGLRRTHHEHRLAFVGKTKVEIARQLKAIEGNGSDLVLKQREQSEDGKPGPVFIFSGQGPQWFAMGRSLLEEEPVYLNMVERCDELLREHAGWSLLEELKAEEPRSRIDQTEVAQPAIFALQMGLADLWRAWGIEPGGIIGHSIGEVAAACVAGILTLEEAVRVVFHRGRLLQRITGQGKMAAVGLSLEAAAELISICEGRLSIAAVNSPTSLTLSGEAEPLAEILKLLEHRKVFGCMLNVNYAFHSPQLEPYQREMSSSVKGISPKSAKVPIISTVTGSAAVEGDYGADYWAENIRRPVRFAVAIEKLIKEGHRTFLEISPSPVLAVSIDQCLNHCSEKGSVLTSLRRGQTDRRAMLETLGELYAQGWPVEWKGIFPHAGRYVSLPSYPFLRQRHKLKVSDTGLTRSRVAAFGDQADLHPLLGGRIRSPLIEDILFTASINGDTAPFLRDHIVFGMVVFPAAGYLEMALAATRSALGPGNHVLEDIAIEEPLVFEDAQPHTLQLAISPVKDGAAGFRVFSQKLEATEEAAWTQHVSGRVRIAAKEINDIPLFEGDSLADLRSRCVDKLDRESYYRHMRECGIEYGEAFKTIESLWVTGDEALGRLRLPEVLLSESKAYRIHPALLDGCLQVFEAIVLQESEDAARSDIYLPIGFGRFRIHGRLSGRFWSHASVHGETDRRETITADLRMFGDDGNLVAEMEGFIAKRADSKTLRYMSQRRLNEWLYEVQWETQKREPVESPSFAGAESKWLLFADRTGGADELVHRFRDYGQRCMVVDPGKSYEVIGEDRFTLDPFRREDFERLLNVALREDGAVCRGIIHLWSLENDMEDPQVSTLKAAQALSCGSVLHLVQALAARHDAEVPRLWLVTSGAQSVGTAPFFPRLAQAPLWGLGKVVALEYPLLHCTRVDLDPVDKRNSSSHLFEEVMRDGREDQIAYRAKTRYAARLARSSMRPRAGDKQLSIPQSESYRLAVTESGVLDNLEFEPVKRTNPNLGQVEIRVHATGLNFRDVLNALGMYPGNPGPPGLECSGRITAVGEGVHGVEVGDEVFGIAGCAFGKYVVADAGGIVRKPESMSYAQAATIPITFLTAYYGLCHLAGMKAGDKVLIHAAAGGVGMAAVQLARRAGAQVFGTAGSPEKQAFLKTLGIDHVMNSRTLDFAGEIMDITDGQGVDIVLNALTGDFISKNLSILAPGGWFIELGKAEIWDNEKVAEVNPNVTYTAFDMAEIIQSDIGLVAQMFQNIMEGLREGSLKPLPFHVFPMESSTSAFRFMAQAKHIGKIVISQEVQATAELTGSVDRFRPDSTYLITGGLGGLGLKVARWMMERGAGYLVLMGRSAPGAKTLETIRAMQEGGGRVTIAQGDVARPEDVARVFAEVEASGLPMRGIVHAAGIIDDGVLEQMNWQRFERVLAPKMEGAWHLHQCSRGLPLDFFILFSSMASLFGNPGQGNYAAANAFMDALAHFRHAEGRRALSINWGPWSEIGMAAAAEADGRDRWTAQGVGSIPPDMGLQVLDTLIGSENIQVAVLPVNWQKFLEQLPGDRKQPFFLEIAKKELTDDSEVTESLITADNFLQQLEEADPDNQSEMLLDHIRDQVTKVLRADTAMEIRTDQGLSDLGMDSLMAVELSNRLSSSLRSSLPSTLAFDYPTIEAISEYLKTCVSCLKTEQNYKEPKPDKKTVQKQNHEKMVTHAVKDLEEELASELKKAGY